MTSLQNGLDLVNRELGPSSDKLKLVNGTFIDATAVVKSLFTYIQRSNRQQQVHLDTEARIDSIKRENEQLESVIVGFPVFTNRQRTDKPIEIWNGNSRHKRQAQHKSKVS